METISSELLLLSSSSSSCQCNLKYTVCFRKKVRHFLFLAQFRQM